MDTSVPRGARSALTLRWGIDVGREIHINVNELCIDKGSS